MANIHQKIYSHGSQVFKFKVHNINCCVECPKKLDKGLKNLKGIESVEIDVSRNLVTVEGLIDPKEVIDKIKKWGKKAELVPEREDTNPQSYTVETNDEDGEKEDLVDASFHHEDSSAPQKDSSAHHKNLFSRLWGKNKGSSNAKEKNDNSESNASSKKEIPDHICTNIYCTLHRRDNYTTSEHVPNMNYGAGYSQLYPGSGSYNYPMMNPHFQPPPTYARRPLCHPGQYYDPKIVPPMTGYRTMERKGRFLGVCSMVLLAILVMSTVMVAII
ncbi:uncharacterized protein LOC141671229 isoform X2 [Apium graveolens]